MTGWLTDFASATVPVWSGWTVTSEITRSEMIVSAPAGAESDVETMVSDTMTSPEFGLVTSWPEARPLLRSSAPTLKTPRTFGEFHF